MSGKVQKRRERLRESLLSIAERRISDAGFGALTARDVAAEAGCAVGAIYNVFDDMDALVEAVNERTADRLEAAVAGALAAEEGTDAKRQLVLLGRTYLDFVHRNPRSWSAIFELAAKRSGSPEKRQARNERLLSHVMDPLRQLLPYADEARLRLLGRALFAAVHGIVSLGQQQGFVSGEPRETAEQIAFIVEAFCEGVTRQQDWPV